MASGVRPWQWIRPRSSAALPLPARGREPRLRGGGSEGERRQSELQAGQYRAHADVFLDDASSRKRSPMALPMRHSCRPSGGADEASMPEECAYGFQPPRQPCTCAACDDWSTVQVAHFVISAVPMSRRSARRMTTAAVLKMPPQPGCTLSPAPAMVFVSGAPAWRAQRPCDVFYHTCSHWRWGDTECPA